MTGSCVCKDNVDSEVNRICDTCLDGYWNISIDNIDGCQGLLCSHCIYTMYMCTHVHTESKACHIGIPGHTQTQSETQTHTHTVIHIRTHRTCYQNYIVDIPYVGNIWRRKILANLANSWQSTKFLPSKCLSFTI